MYNLVDEHMPMAWLDYYPAALLTVYIRIKLQLDLQEDKSYVVVKGPFFPQV
jgi:hypothetical protein